MACKGKGNVPNPSIKGRVTPTAKKNVPKPKK